MELSRAYDKVIFLPLFSLYTRVPSKYYTLHFCSKYDSLKGKNICILYIFFIVLRKKKLEKGHLKNACGELGFPGCGRMVAGRVKGR